MTDLADTCATAAKRSWIDCERESREAPPKGGNADDPVLQRLPSLARPAAATFVWQQAGRVAPFRPVHIDGRSASKRRNKAIARYSLINRPA